MVETHGGTIVPPRDGDRVSSDGEDGLVAQIIPLRHRERDPDEHQGPRTPASEETLASARELSPRGERSIWDPPAAELRRRRTEPGSTQSLTAPARGVASLASRLSWRVAAVPAVAAVGAAVLVLVLVGALRSQSGSAMRQVASSTPSANRRSAIANHSRARGSRQAQTAAGSHRQQQLRTRELHRHHPQSPPAAAHGTASESAVADSTAGAPASTIHGRMGASSTAKSPPANLHNESALAQAEAAPASSASTPATPQSQCVPGELGC